MNRSDKKIKRALKRKKKLEERMARMRGGSSGQDSYDDLIYQLEEVNSRLAKYQSGMFDDEDDNLI